jgi:hypothetical protein
MADMKLDFAWAIGDEGELIVSVNPASMPDVELGSLALDTPTILDELDDDLSAYAQGASDAVLNDWELLQSFFTRIADEIGFRIQQTQARRRGSKLVSIR